MFHPHFIFFFTFFSFLHGQIKIQFCNVSHPNILFAVSFHRFKSALCQPVNPGIQASMILIRIILETAEVTPNPWSTVVSTLTPLIGSIVLLHLYIYIYIYLYIYMALLTSGHSKHEKRQHKLPHFECCSYVAKVTGLRCSYRLCFD